MDGAYTGRGFASLTSERITLWSGVTLLLFGLLSTDASLLAASHRSENFVVHAPTPDLARAVAEEAERSRRTFCEDWLGSNLDTWRSPCEIKLCEGATASTGWTSYRTSRGQVEDLQMILRGQPDWVLETVLPHEVSHAVMASVLGQAIPRWADEGIALMSETDSVRRRQRLIAREAIDSQSVLSLRQILAMTEYPTDHGRLLQFYARSHSLTEFLVHQQGRDQLVRFLQGARACGWDEAIRQYYAFDDIERLEAAWNEWVSDGTTGIPLVGSGSESSQ